MEIVTFKTHDGVMIVGDYFQPESHGTYGVLLLHMMPATRKSFSILGSVLATNGFHALAIDLRGHGDSLYQEQGEKKETLNFLKFSDTEHQASIYDIREALTFLQAKGISKIFLIGASIGANLSLQALVEDRDLLGAILLSPGFNYRGIETRSLVEKLYSSQSVFYVGSHDDAPVDTMVQELYKKTPSTTNKTIRIFENAGHGTTILEREAGYINELAQWLKSRVL